MDFLGPENLRQQGTVLTTRTEMLLHGIRECAEYSSARLQFGRRV